MSYWDTSALVKLYVQEADSAAFENHLLQTSGAGNTSRIAIYEARATFRRKEVEGALKPGLASLLYTRLRQHISIGRVHLVELDVSIEQEYGRVLDLCYGHQPTLPIRTLDVLRLACARVVGATELVATDKRLRDAAKLLKLCMFPS